MGDQRCHPWRIRKLLLLLLPLITLLTACQSKRAICLGGLIIRVAAGNAALARVNRTSIVGFTYCSSRVLLFAWWGATKEADVG